MLIIIHNIRERGRQVKGKWRSSNTYKMAIEPMSFQKIKWKIEFQKKKNSLGIRQLFTQTFTMINDERYTHTKVEKKTNSPPHLKLRINDGRPVDSSTFRQQQQQQQHINIFLHSTKFRDSTPFFGLVSIDDPGSPARLNSRNKRKVETITKNCR